MSTTELYHQMTIDEWLESKKRIHEMIRMAKASFIVIGYELRKIEDSEAYRMDGYASLAEFAKAEYGFEKTMTSRLIEVNKAFSERGYSDILIEDAEGFTFTKLIEMKDLPKEDLELIRPGTKREDIRELKRLEAEPGGSGSVETGETGIEEVLTEFFRKERDMLNELFARYGDVEPQGEEELAEIISPTGNRAFRKGLWMVFFYADSIRLKSKATGEIIGWSYMDFWQRVKEIFGLVAAGGHTWEAFFGEPEGEGRQVNTGLGSDPGEEFMNAPAGAGEEDRRQREEDVNGNEAGGDGSISAEVSGNQGDHSGGEERGDTGNRPASEGKGIDHKRGTEENGADSGGNGTENRAPQVAPAQPGRQVSTGRDGTRKEQLAGKIDDMLEKLTKQIGDGRYSAAMATAQMIVYELGSIAALIREEKEGV